MPNIYALTVFGVVSALGYVLNRQQKPDLNEPPNSRQDLIACKAWQAHEKVVAALVKYYEIGGQEESSELAFVRWKTLRNGGLPIENIARSEVSMTVGQLSNTVPANFWVLFGLYSRPELLEEVRQEVAQKALYTSDNVRILHISTLHDDCPLLLSVFQKTLRTRTWTSPSRFVPDDFLLTGQYSLWAGSVASMPDASVGRTPRRFLTTNEDARRVCGFMMFGASPILCPGRHFASAEILAKAATTVLLYDLTPMGGVWNVPKINTMAITSVIQPLKGGYEVTVSPRKEYEGTQWACTVREGNGMFNLMVR